MPKLPRSTVNFIITRACSGSIKSYIPTKPSWIEIDRSRLPDPPKLTHQLVDHLERLSLVRFSNDEAVKHLEKAISYADQLQLIDTTGVEPLDSVLENYHLPLRDDIVTEGNCQKEILSNAAVTVEEYFVTPPGNIPLEERKDKLGSPDDLKLKRSKNTWEDDLV